MDGGGRVRWSRGVLPFLAIEFFRSGRKPPVTVGLILANTLVYLQPAALHRFLPTIDEVWFNSNLILKYGDLKRFFLSPFYHMNEAHLVYNMVSLLWKGSHLEISMGSVEFASMIATLLGLSQGITLLLAKSLLLFNYETAYYREYAVGFSGVLFALKVVLNAGSDYANIYGFRVPAHYSAWAELVLIQLITPGVSFLGHLSGILAGLVYLQLRGSSSGSDPLTALLGRVGRILSRPLRVVRGFFQRPRILGRGRVGRTASDHSVWRCPTCTYDNSVWADVCEMCSTERNGLGFSLTTEVLDVEELRRRRLQRFGG